MTAFIDYLADELSLDRCSLSKFIRSAPYRYKKFRIPKKRPDEFRNIAQPSKELKVLQRLGIAFLEQILTVHDSAMGYVSGKGIKDNAWLHASNRYLLKMDFRDFFPSIVPEDLVYAGNRAGYSVPADYDIWARLFFYRPTRDSDLCLSIGAPSSPFISNAVMYELDDEICRTCKDLRVQYSRYADDLTFSTNRKNVLFDLPDMILKFCEQTSHPSLLINDNKTVFSSKKHNRHVTGLVIDNEGKVSLGRRRKRMISSLVHKSQFGVLTVEELKALAGLLAFAHDIEPDFSYRLIKKYGAEVVAQASRQPLEASGKRL